MTDATDPARAAQDGLPPPAVAEDVALVRARLLEVYQSHGDELGRFVLGVTRDPELARDVMQATLSKALELGHTARPETFKGWLFRVAFREALVARRRERAGRLARRRLADLGPAADPTSAAEGLVRDETAEAVRQALQRLPEPQRLVVVARMYDDKTFAEIARDAGLPLGTVLTRMRLALDKLRAALRPDGGDTHPGPGPASEPPR